MPDGYGIKGFRRDSLPVIPERFELIPRQVKTDKGYKADAAAVKQIKVITKLWNESDSIIVATDCAREGELIFRYLYAYTGGARADTHAGDGLQALLGKQAFHARTGTPASFYRTVGKRK